MTLTKNKLFQSFLFIILVGGLFLVGINQVQAVGASYYPQDTTVSMTVDSFTIVGPSDADSVTTTATTVTVTISAGEKFTFKSNSGKQLNTTGTITSKTCTPSTSTVIINPETGVSGRTVVITPQGGGCDPSGSSGVVGSSGSSSGGGGTTVAVATPTPISTPSTTLAPSATPTPTPGVNYAPAHTPAPTPLPLPGSLAKLYRKSGDAKVYVVETNGLLKLIKSLEEFNSAGYRWQNVKVIPSKQFSKLKIDTSDNLPLLTTPAPIAILSHLKIKSGIKYVNIRSASSTKGKIVGRALSGQEFEFSDFKNGWYRIKKDGKDLGWITGDYASKF